MDITKVILWILEMALLLIVLFSVFSRCKHKWEIIYTLNMRHLTKGEFPSGRKYVMQCKGCGKLKVKNT